MCVFVCVTAVDVGGHLSCEITNEFFAFNLVVSSYTSFLRNTISTLAKS